MTALVFLAIFTLVAVAVAIDKWHRRRHTHMRPLNYRDDRDGWTRFGRAIEGTRRS